MAFVMDFRRLVHEAWPAFEQHERDGWVLRYAGGVTDRANSVYARNVPEDMDAALEYAERFYAERGLTPVFTVGDPGLDQVLERRGYRRTRPVQAMVARLDTLPEPPAHPVRIEDEPWDAWMDAWWSVDGRYADRIGDARRIVTGVPAWYAAVEQDGVPLAVGRGVPQGDTLGIYCMATLPAARRRGLGRGVIRALVRRAAAAGMSSAYLVVTEANDNAKELYRGEGFEVAGEGYHYRVGEGLGAAGRTQGT
ncbi:GNAT family N-acetyltransferase [Nonomuraea endophytica]|uniref:Ribosomal protein S18 acetylase RimI-like enzyme n=1 Tax=Nonomuraea endophytica TaxID=714136 RepID=A0A7W8EMI7_9ACTN|nr:GNAT family N-acetyltransferase [Nonomuraea endophytica]MBB5084443.1 ribosomal protein S18 acetylase RimI-like enzyme [Nonomuraea endophytica]